MSIFGGSQALVLLESLALWVWQLQYTEKGRACRTWRKKLRISGRVGVNSQEGKVWARGRAKRRQCNLNSGKDEVRHEGGARSLRLHWEFCFVFQQPWESNGGFFSNLNIYYCDLWWLALHSEKIFRLLDRNRLEGTEGIILTTVRRVGGVHLTRRLQTGGQAAGGYTERSASRTASTREASLASHFGSCGKH